MFFTAFFAATFDPFFMRRARTKKNENVDDCENYDFAFSFPSTSFMFFPGNFMFRPRNDTKHLGGRKKFVIYRNSKR